MRNNLFILVLMILSTSASFAQISLSVDILDDGDGESPPAGLLVVDVLADVSPTDAWTAMGIRVVATNGAQLVYANDPNSGDAILINPGAANRFVTCLSRPRSRLGSARFTNADANIAGDYCPSGPMPPTATATEMNVISFTVPNSNASGAIARIVIQGNFCGSAPCCTAEVFPIDQVPTGYTAYLQSVCPNASSGTVTASQDDPTPQGLSWAVAVRAAVSCRYDINGDNAIDVNVDDIQAFLPAFGACTGDAGFVGAADVLADGCIDLSDLATLLAHFGDTCCPN